MSVRETPALVFEKFGPPAEVLALRALPLAEMAPDRVRVRLRLSPVNPADFNSIEGTYGLKPELPAVAGLEGVGEVVEIGSGVTHLKAGDLVSLPRSGGHWRSEWVGPSREVSRFPNGLTVEQAAIFRINPATAWCLLHEFVALKPGSWVVQNAATSGVGKAVIAIARHLGLRTLNLVRRESDIAKLKALGADEVLVSDQEIRREALIAKLKAESGAIKKEIGAPIRLGLNAVGGESAALVGKLLAPGGVHVTYGAMGRQPLRISNGALIFQNLSYRGFWVSRWREEAERNRVAAMEQTLAAFFAGKLLRADIEQTYPLADFAAALAHAAQEGRSGKIAFRID